MESIGQIATRVLEQTRLRMDDNEDKKRQQQEEEERKRQQREALQEQLEKDEAAYRRKWGIDQN